MVVIDSQLNIFTAFFVSLLIGASESALVLFLLGRPKIVALRASTPYGWTLGLGMGAMFTSVLIVRLFDPQLTSDFSGFSIISILISLSLAVIACVGNAEISTFQGVGVLNSQTFQNILSQCNRTLYTDTWISADSMATSNHPLFSSSLVLFLAYCAK